MKPTMQARLLAAAAGALLLADQAAAQPTLKWKRQEGGGGTIQMAALDSGIFSRAAGFYVSGFATHASGLDGETGTSSDDVVVKKYDKGGTRQWTRMRGGTNDETAYGCELDNSANVYVAGSTQSTTLDSKSLIGTQDAYIMKWDTNGNHLWTSIQGASSQTVGIYGLAVDTDGNAYIGGDTTGSVDSEVMPGSASAKCAVVMRFKTDGTYDWTKIHGSSGGTEVVRDVALDGDNLYVTGMTNGDWDSQTHVGDYDVFIIKFDTLGNGGANVNHAWTRMQGSTNADVGVALAFDASGNVFVAGDTAGDCNSDPSSAANTLVGTGDAMFMKFTSAGTWQWTVTRGVTGQLWEVRGMVIDAANNVFISGGAKDTSNYWSTFVLKYDSAGTFQWQEDMGDSDTDTKKEIWGGIRIDTTSRYAYAVGYVAGTGSFEGLTNVGTNDWILSKWQVTTVAVTAGSDPIARYGDRVQKFSLKPGELTPLLETPELVILGSVFEGGGSWEQWFDRIILATPARDRFLRIRMRRDLLERNHSGIPKSDFRTLEVALGWGEEDRADAVLTQIPSPKVPIPFSFLGHEVSFEKIRRTGQKFPAIGQHLRECAEIAGPSLRFHICSSPASEYYGKQRHLSVKYAHLDLIVKDIKEPDELSGLLPELWGLRPHSEQTTACLDDDGAAEDVRLKALSLGDGDAGNETARVS